MHRAHYGKENADYILEEQQQEAPELCLPWDKFCVTSLGGFFCSCRTARPCLTGIASDSPSSICPCGAYSSSAAAIQHVLVQTAGVPMLVQSRLPAQRFVSCMRATAVDHGPSCAQRPSAQTLHSCVSGDSSSLAPQRACRCSAQLFMVSCI